MKGSIQKRVGKHGVSYRVRVDLGPDPITGERRQRSETFSTKKAAESALAKWLTEIEKGTAVDGTKMTLGEYLDYWLENYARHNLRATTLRMYTNAIRLHIKPALGNIPLQKLTAARLQSFYSERLRAGRTDGRGSQLAAKTVKDFHVILHKSLQQAVRWQLVGRNVTDTVDPPHVSRAEMRIWDHETVRQFLTYSEHDHYSPLWLVAIMTGLRRGELLGLKWDDIDLERGTLAVRRNLVEIGSTLYWQEPKTAKGRRVVDLPQVCIVALKAHRTKQLERRLQLGPAWQDTGLVFTTRRGNPITPRNMVRRFKRLIELAGVPEIRFHDLRHTSASLMLASGIHPKIVSERLGHSTISITLDVYSHVLPTMQRDAADRLQAALFPPDGQNEDETLPKCS